MIFSLLSKPVQKSVWKMGWKDFTTIQEAAIERILTTDHNYILASATASGKTEAVFLPILSLLNPEEEGVLVLYISPLRALINDQFLRIQDLCSYLHVMVTPWHSDVKVHQKEKLIKKPKGILQITPESLEAILLHHPEYISLFFQNLKFIIIDELHSFIGHNRGIQLQSILERIRQKINIYPRTMGLSATLHDYSSAKAFMGTDRKTYIIKIEDKRPIKYHLIHYEAEGTLVPPLIKDIYLLTQKYRTLIFTNSRSRAEEVSVKLKRMASALGGHSHYFTHHSSLAREEREHIEKSLREKDTPLGVCCTSTLELGIDIGTMDLIIQLDSTFSVSSLIQRLGRSGRKEGIPRMLQVYTTDSWNLLQSLGCMELFREGFMDSHKENNYPLDVLLQQILSILIERQGERKGQLIDDLKKNRAFQMIEEEDVELLVTSMIEMNYIQDLRVELIIGEKGEEHLRNRRIYTAFDTSTRIKVYHGQENLGFLSYSPQLMNGDNILLGARMWEIQYMDLKKGIIFVKPAKSGRPPTFSSQPLYIHSAIREKMLEILYSKEVLPYMDKRSAASLGELREKFAKISLKDAKRERPYFKTWNNFLLYSFASSRINNTLHAALLLLTEKVHYHHHESSFSFRSEDSLPELRQMILDLLEYPKDLVQDIHLTPFLLSNWATCLPITLKVQWLLHNYFDIAETRKFLERISFVGAFGEGPKEKKKIERA